MNELWVIYALVFGAAMLGIQAGYWFFVRGRKTQQVINRRLALKRPRRKRDRSSRNAAQRAQIQQQPKSGRARLERLLDANRIAI